MSAKKKFKLSLSPRSSKRASESLGSPRKRLKFDTNEEEEMEAIKRNNLSTACEQVSRKNYFDYRTRFLLVYLPSCLKTNCKHHDKTEEDIRQMPYYTNESMKTELRNNMWHEALEICNMSLTESRYLSSDVLQNITEIIMNVHDDIYSEHTAKHIVDKCQQILMQNFSTHPPCLVKNLRNCYNSFLTSPLDLKKNTFSNRQKYEHNKGIVKYCLNRLEHELGAESIDGPLVNKCEMIPEEIKESVQSVHWQKDNLDIFEALDRKERIERLFVVLEAVVELLQFDLAIWHSRCLSDLERHNRHIMRSHKPLMEYMLWSDNTRDTGTVTENCLQILRIFANVVHLEYPDNMVKIITIWLNTMIQTFYFNETKSTTDYPNTSRLCSSLAYNFYKIMSNMPHDAIIRIMERIEPKFMRHLIGMLHLNELLSTFEDCVIKLLHQFISGSHWKSYPSDDTEIKFPKKLFMPPKKINEKFNYLFEKCKNWTLTSQDNINYGKLESKMKKSEVKVGLSHIVHTFYLTLEAYLDAYDVQSVQEMWNNLNQQKTENARFEINGSYSITESFTKKYAYILETMKELVILFSDLKRRKELPELFNIFENIIIIELKK